MPVYIQKEIYELYPLSQNAIFPPHGFETATHWYLACILSLTERAEQKPKAPVHIFQYHYRFYFSTHQAPADMLIQQTVTILTLQIHSKADSWAALVSEHRWKRQKSWTSGEMQKHQQFYLHVEEKAAVLLCFLLGMGPLPWGGRVSDLIQSHTWTWVCYPVQMVVALKKNCW